MKLKRKIAGLISIVLLLAMVMPLTVLADSDEEYENIVILTEEEVDAILLEHGVNLDKEISTWAGLGDSSIVVKVDSNRIEVAYYTEATIVANEIGVQSLDLYEGSTAVISDYKDFDCFKDSYRGGFAYSTPVSGKKYYAAGTNYAILTTTRYNKYNVSETVTY